ncbi:MAG: DUF1564 domain-containing protein [Leptospiraceae bacterium]|nr:DUF1564 domain-containing protein [Leptospiraceae bacterium]
MMKTYFTSHEPKQTLKLKEHKKTVSTLRIPVILKQRFNKEINRHGNVAQLLTHLIKKYRFLFYAEGLPFSKKIKKEYQERGTKVFIKTFRPELSDWIEIGMWADTLNFSICKLFVILLWFEEKYSFDEKNWIGVSLNSFASCVVTTSFNLRVPKLVKILRKGRSILERGITFSEPPS